MEFRGSDHRPLISFFDSKRKKNRALFRFDRRFRDNQEVKQPIAEAWQAQPEASVCHRLSLCRRAIATWSREQAMNSKLNIDRIHREINDSMSNPVGCKLTISSLNGELLAAYRAEEEFWRQRSRLVWLVAGDKNSGYFHAVAKGRGARNKISVLEDAAGTVLYEEELIAHEIVTYFQQIFSSDATGTDEAEIYATIARAIKPCISREINDKLLETPTTTEIKKALFAIHPDKAPGPDGFSACFFQANWETVAVVISRDITEFFASGQLRPSINETHIRLIPKTTTSKRVAEYRPIALCNVTYKIIS